MTSTQSKTANVFTYIKKHAEPVLAFYALGIYVWLIFEKLATFPIYFFCDEAMLGVDAHAILTTGADYTGASWPFFFYGLGYYSHAISVYFNVPFIALFGLSEFSIRLTTATISVLGVVAVYMLPRYVYKLKSAWMTFILLAVTPLWFLHSRTGFEYVMAASFFLAFGLFYILAFSRHWLFVVPAAVCAAATFYAHTTGRGWIGISLILLFLFNLREHIRHWRRVLIGLVILILLFAPYIHLQVTRPEIAMRRLDSLKNYYAFINQPLAQQATRILKNYARGLNPAFWYTWKGTQNTGPMERHVIPPLSLVIIWTFPFACFAMLMLLRHIRKLENRTLLALFLAAPSSAAIVEFNIHRGLPIGVFLTVFALLGVGWIQRRIGGYELKRLPWLKHIITGLLILGLSGYALWFRHHVHHVARYSYRDYGFYGVQMGAPEVFTWIKKHHNEYKQIFVAHNLFNAGHIFIPFYLQDDAARKTTLFDMNQIYKTLTFLPEKAAYIAPVAFFPGVQALGSPIEKQVLEIITDPRGNPLFEIMTLRKQPDFARWFHQEDIRRRKLWKAIVKKGDSSIEVQHPKFDIGGPQSLFDGNPETLARTDRINAAHIIVHLPVISIKHIRITISHTGSADIYVKTQSGDQTTDWGEQSYIRTSAERFSVLTFETPEQVSGVTGLDITVHVTETDKYGYVHINEIDWE